VDVDCDVEGVVETVDEEIEDEEFGDKLDTEDEDKKDEDNGDEDNEEEDKEDGDNEEDVADMETSLSLDLEACSSFLTKGCERISARLSRLEGIHSVRLSRSIAAADVFLPHNRKRSSMWPE